MSDFDNLDGIPFFIVTKRCVEDCPHQIVVFINVEENEAPKFVNLGDLVCESLIRKYKISPLTVIHVFPEKQMVRLKFKISYFNNATCFNPKSVSLMCIEHIREKTNSKFPSFWNCKQMY